MLRLLRGLKVQHSCRVSPRLLDLLVFARPWINIEFFVVCEAFALQYCILSQSDAPLEPVRFATFVV